MEFKTTKNTIFALSCIAREGFIGTIDVDDEPVTVDAADFEALLDVADENCMVEDGEEQELIDKMRSELDKQWAAS